MQFSWKVFIVLLIFFACSKDITPDNAVVVTRHHLATDIGAEILKNGGNAIDSAVAVAFALAVVNPSAGNLGGGGFMLYFDSKNNKTYALDYRERAPKAATEKMFLNDSGEVIKGLSLNSYLASAVPGTVKGMFKAHQLFGSMPMEKLISPSIKIAKQGFKLSDFQAKNFNKYKQKFLNGSDSELIFIKNEGFKEGDIFMQTDLAKTLELIKLRGQKAFYEGKIAKQIVSDFKQNDGLISFEDLLSYDVYLKDPICGEYKEYDICSMPLPSSGGIALIQMFNIIENFELSDYSHNSLEYIDLLTKVMSFAYADRSKYLGDQDFFNSPVKKLTSKKYAKEIAKKINSNEVMNVEPGIYFYEGDQTTHFSVIDFEGNVVSNTYTLNTAYGSGIVAKGTGILMNNEMDDFSIKPGTPNVYGLVGSEANKIESKKSPLSSMSPTIVFKDSVPFLITGSQGGSMIINTVFQEILNLIEFNMNLSESNKKPKIHYQWKPDILFHEELNENLLKELSKEMKLIQRKIGETQSIAIENNQYKGWSDYRRPDGKKVEIH